MLRKNSQSAFLNFLLTVLIGSEVSVCVSGLKYVWGDAFDDTQATGPDGNAYPWDRAARIASKQRSPRFLSDDSKLLSPKETRDILLRAFRAQELGEFLPGTSYMPQPEAHPNTKALDKERAKNKNGDFSRRQGRAKNVEDLEGLRYDNVSEIPLVNEGKKQSALLSAGGGEMEGCVPPRLCASTYNTTAPLYGVSLTSGQPVTIVQKFPDLLQQVVFQVCKTKECEILQGECVQTYLPYLFLVIPLGPVTLTGQDYVLVESGCVCRPKYARKHDEPPPLPFIQPLHN